MTGRPAQRPSVAPLLLFKDKKVYGSDMMNIGTQYVQLSWVTRHVYGTNCPYAVVVPYYA